MVHRAGPSLLSVPWVWEVPRRQLIKMNLVFIGHRPGSSTALVWVSSALSKVHVLSSRSCWEVVEGPKRSSSHFRHAFSPIR